MPESDQTRWIGVRPTTDPEDIPVSIATWPLCTKVEPCPANNPFRTLTRKLAPAISDLQAIESVIRYEYRDSGVTGDITKDSGTVPAGKLWVMTMACCSMDNGVAVRMSHMIRDGVDEYYINGLVAPPQAVPLVSQNTIIMQPDEYFRFTWYAVDIVARILSCAFRAYQVSQYT